ncbi:M56 family metallopeptidase [Nonomuraea sp. NPDC050790]|uniref:M56 family metallopeptidase n=1 Tax=Nonomuraea sp. NPDC050790 TaxID=3364371 RepID=UPI00379FAAE6
MTVWLVVAGVALVPVVFGGRVAAMLAEAEWVRRHPRAALVLWQAIGLAGGLGAVGVGLVAAVAPLAAAFPHGMHTFGHQVADGRGLAGLGPVHSLALAWSAALIAWLVAHTARTALRTVARQRRQRTLVDVLADRIDEHEMGLLPDRESALPPERGGDRARGVARDRGEGVYVLPGAEPVAYCVPGWRSRVVLSRGALELLDPAELRAVLAHERAHARGRHDLFLMPFQGLAAAFPWLPVVKAARRAVPVLLEMLADDRARQVSGDRTLARAIVLMAAPKGPGFGLADEGAVQRVERLLGTSRGGRWVPAAVYAAALALMSGPVAIMIAPVVCGVMVAPVCGAV